MESYPSVEIIIILVLLAISSIASCIETAIASSSKVKLQSIVDNDKNANLSLKLKDMQQKVISCCLIVNNIVNVSMSTIATIVFTKFYKNIPLALLTGLLTFVLLIFGEITPKSLASKYPETIVIIFSKIIYFFVALFTPIISFLNFISNIFLKPFHTNVESIDTVVSEDELKTMVNMSHEEGVIESEEKEIIHNVFEFGDLTLKDIMVPRVDMVSVEINTSYDDLLAIFKKERYSRIPIYEETIDKIVGIVILKDFFVYNSKNKDQFKIKNIIRDAYFLYENKKVIDTLTEMQKTSNNMAIVLDEYGSTAGMVTLEDILEEIVGDIKDEFDQDEENEIKKISNNDYLIEGFVKIDDINEKLGTDLKNDEFDTISGIIISSINTIPTVGVEVDYQNYHLKVIEMDNNRILKVRLTIK